MAEDDVLAAAQRGDRDAHARLYEIFAKPVYTLARRMLGSRAHAEDVLQETFVEVLCNIADYRGDAVLGTWIKRIAVNKCLAYLRSGWRAAGTRGRVARPARGRRHPRHRRPRAGEPRAYAANPLELRAAVGFADSLVVQT